MVHDVRNDLFGERQARQPEPAARGGEGSWLAGNHPVPFAVFSCLLVLVRGVWTGEWSAVPWFLLGIVAWFGFFGMVFRQDR